MFKLVFPPSKSYNAFVSIVKYLADHEYNGTRLKTLVDHDVNKTLSSYINLSFAASEEACSCILVTYGANTGSSSSLLSSSSPGIASAIAHSSVGLEIQ